MLLLVFQHRLLPTLASGRVVQRSKGTRMDIKLDLWTWITGLVVAAHIIAIIFMLIRATYLKRKERTQGRPVRVSRRD